MPVRIENTAEGATAEMYAATNAIMEAESNPPAGQIVHTAAIVDGNLKIVDVWESEADYDRFREERLLPAIEQVAGPEAVQGPPTHTVHELIGFVKH